jgi:hypothetical protein
MIDRLGQIAVLIAISVAAPARADDVLLGILEEVPGVYVRDHKTTRVRTVFTHKDGGWAAFKSDCGVPECLTAVTSEYPKEVAWFVGFDGHQVGYVVARTPQDFAYYAHIGLQDIVDGQAPVIGKPSYEYGGFGGNEVHRPLVTVSKPYFDDPARWKRIAVTAELRKQALAILRSQVPQLCKEGPSEERPLVPLRYGAKNLSVRAHRSRDGRSILMINVEGALYCDGGAGDGSFDPHTFAIDKDGKARFLGAGLMLLDAGDYDHDGRSELVFALSLYNRGGYVLFSDNLKEQSQFVFGYH